jgi:TPR repeat protein
MKAFILFIVLAGVCSTVAAAPTFAELCDAAEERAKAGDAQAQLELAMCYLKGTGRARDVDIAERWLEKSASTGLPAAQTSLAALILLDKQESARFDEALTLLKAAVAEDNGTAGLILGLANLNGLGTTSSKECGLRWLRFAAERGDRLANFILFAAHWFGLLDVEKNAEMAEEYWTFYAFYYRHYPEFLVERANHLPRDRILSEFVFDENELRQIANEIVRRTEEM